MSDKPIAIKVCRKVAELVESGERIPAAFSVVPMGGRFMDADGDECRRTPVSQFSSGDTIFVKVHGIGKPYSDGPELHTKGLPPDVAKTLREDMEGVFGPLGGEDSE